MPPFLQFLLRRLLAIPISLLIITMLLYAGVMLTPVETRAELYFPNTNAPLTDEARQRIIDNIIKKYHLRDSYPVQYVNWIKSLFQGGWGYSPTLDSDVLPALLRRTPATAELILPTPMTTASPTLTATAVVVTQPTLTPSANAALLASYRLQRGEFPYCIARRFNVDPNELLSLSGLLGREIFPAGTLLQIPQTGKPFPGERMLQLHPALYSVSRSGQTLYGVACAFGDIDPLLIAQSNNLPVDSQLYKGQQLQIP